jgi:serine/threonine protein kinase
LSQERYVGIGREANRLRKPLEIRQKNSSISQRGRHSKRGESGGVFAVAITKQEHNSSLQASLDGDKRIDSGLSFRYGAGDQTLANFIQDRFNTGPWARPDLGEVWAIMLDLAGGLRFLHRRKMIHRDLKPANGYTFLGIC